MDHTPAQNITILQNAQADLTARLQAAARVLFDYHHLSRDRFLTVYHNLASTPDELLRKAADILLCFAEGMRFEHRRPAAAPEMQPPQKKSPASRLGCGKGTPKSLLLREALLRPEHDPDSPKFKAIPGKGGHQYRFVTKCSLGGYTAIIRWIDFHFTKPGIKNPIDAQKTALRAARAFLAKQKGKS
jgi:hypothetical protein